MAFDRSNGMRRGIALIPNLLTTANLFCGFFSILQSLKGQYVLAVWSIILASFFDFLDGRVARMTGTQSDFGVEYDSLADLTTFCMAPAVLSYSWGLKDFGKFGIAVCFLYFACGALRLARYNVQVAGVEKKDFQGLPTPAAAGTVVSFILFHLEFFGRPWLKNPYHFALITVVALLMISTVRYKSLKQDTGSRTSFFKFVGGVVLLAVLFMNPEQNLFPFGIFYISLGIIQTIYLFFTKTQTTDLSIPAPVARRHSRPRRFRRRSRFQKIEPSHSEIPEPSATVVRLPKNSQN